jgi:hypothetical protein
VTRVQEHGHGPLRKEKVSGGVLVWREVRVIVGGGREDEGCLRLRDERTEEFVKRQVGIGRRERRNEKGHYGS